MNEIDSLRAALRGLSLAVPRWVEDIDGDDPVAMVLLLDDLRSLRQELATVEAYVESQASRAMTTRKLMLPDGRIAERYSGKQRKDWRHDLVMGELWDLAVEIAAGDLDDAIGAFRTLVVQVAGLTYWRTGELRRLGIDPDAYCTVEGSRATVRIPAKPAVSVLAKAEGGGPDA